jgi:small subunit ribosomal protein S2
MKRFLFGERSGIYIVDLHQTLDGIEHAYKFVRETVADGGTVLFVGTKKQAQEPVARHAGNCNQPYVNFRWLGGMLTNFQTVHGRTSKLRELQRVIDTGEVDQMIKKEGLKLRREATKLERNLGGIKNLERLPSAVFVIDTKKEHIAVTEANRLGIPVVAVVDTNCDPDVIQYVIPGNDDAIRSANLMCRVIADAVIEGKQIAAKRGARSATNGDGGGAGTTATTAAPRPVRSAEEEAEHQRVQQAARDAAAAKQREIEDRAAQAKAAADTTATAVADEPEAPAALDTATGEGGADATAADATTPDTTTPDTTTEASTSDTTSEGTDNG